jgi:uncharacterized membrane protein
MLTTYLKQLKSITVKLCLKGVKYVTKLSPRDISLSVVSFLIQWLPWLIIGYFSYQYIRLGLLNELHLRNGLDLGIYHQAIFHVSNFELPNITLKGRVMWGDHANFFFYLLAPIYRLVPDVRTLLIIQALAMTTSAWAMFKVAQKLVRNYLFSLVILAGYLLFFGVQYALDFDFHPSVFTGAAIAWLIYAFTYSKWKLYWMFLFFGLLTQEDAAPMLFMIGLYLAFTKRRAVGIMTMILSICYFFLIGFYVMPIWTPNNQPLTHFDVSTYGDTPLENFFGLLAHPTNTIQSMISE